MHSKGKSFVLRVLAVTLTLAMLSAVTVSTSLAANPTIQSTSSSLWSSKVATLNMYTVGTAQAGIARIETAVDKYLAGKKLMNIKLNWEALGYDGTTYGKVDTMLATGQPADLVFTSNWISDYNTNAADGYYTDLGPYLAKNPDLVSIIGKDFLGASKINGKNYALPTNKEKAHNWGLLVETADLKKFDIDPSKIKTLSDIEKYFPAVKAAGIIPMDVAAMNDPYHLLDWDTIIGDGTPGAMYGNNSSTVVIDQFLDPLSIAFYNKMKTYHDNGWIRADSTSVSDQEKEIASGKYFCGIWSLVPGKAASESISNNQNLTQIDLTKPVMSNRETTGAMMAIPVSCTQKNLAFGFLKLLYTDKTLINLMNFGQQGTDYTLTSKGQVTPKSNASYAFDSGWIMGNQFNDITTSNVSPDLWKQYAAYNASATVMQSLGFMYDETAMKSQIAVTTQTINNEYPALFNGTAPDVNAAVAKLKADLTADGVNSLIADMQKQYNKFLASK